MQTTHELTKTTVPMIHCWQRGDQKGCYRLYFALSLEDRQLVREMFKGARRHHHSQFRKDAKGIFKMLRKRFDDEVRLMIDILHTLLRHWFFSDKQIFTGYWIALDGEEKGHMLAALREVIAQSSREEFRQAAKDIPLFLQSQNL